MERDRPTVEPLHRLPPFPEEETSEPWLRSIRARVFGISFILTLIIGLAATFGQPTVYRSSATVLMSAPTAIDATIKEADIQSVAIQRRILLGGVVTGSLLSTLDDDHGIAVDLAYLREVLQVNPVEGTNLVEMTALGAEAELLPTLVHSWIEVYLQIRAADVQDRQKQTLLVVESQLSGLATKVDAAREALALYRDENDITSAERQENDAMARLDGLSTALNKAVEAEITTRADLESLTAALAAGKNVVPQSDRKSVEGMHSELSQLKNTLKNLNKNYTMDYIHKQPKWRDIPNRIAELEAELAEVLEDGQSLILSNAERDYASAGRQVAQVQERYEAQEKEAARFTTLYATHQSLAEDLANLEALNRETQARLVQVEVNQVEKYPQVSVIDRPAGESIRVGPDLKLWLGGTLAAALGVGILSVWMYGFLGPRPAKTGFVTLSGVHMYPQDVQSQLGYAAQPTPGLAQNPTPLIQRHEQAQEAVTDANGEPQGAAPPRDNNTEPDSTPKA
jgi:succinoglycan biosynthesis transport protein ExoP